MINKNKPPVDKRVVLVLIGNRWASGCLTSAGWYKTYDCSNIECRVNGEILEKIIGYIDMEELLANL